MDCPFCGYKKSKVVDTDSMLEREIARCRICLCCNRAFTTTEIVDKEIYLFAGTIENNRVEA